MARAVQLVHYRQHRLEVLDARHGWSVVIHAPSPALFQPAVMRTDRLSGLAELLDQARRRVDDSIGASR